MATIKRPLSAYMHWLSANRPRIVKENPGKLAKEIAQLAGIEWGKLAGSATRKKFEEQAAKDKERYEAEVKLNPDQKPKNKKRSVAKVSTKKEKDPNAPSRPNSAYILWSKDNRARVVKANPTVAPKAIMGLLAAEWKNNPKDKKKYEDAATKQKERYAKDKVTYEGEQREKKGPKRGLSAYLLWLNDNRERINKAHPGIKVTEVSKIGGAEWKKLQLSKTKKDVEERAKYTALAEKDKQRYLDAKTEHEKLHPEEEKK